MDEKHSISKDVLFDIFKNKNEAALRSPTPNHLLSRSGNSAFKTPTFGSTPVNYNIPLQPRTEHLFLNQPFYNTSADNYGRSFTEATSSTIIPGNSLQNPLSFNNFQPNLPPTTKTSKSREREENQPKHPIRPLPMKGIPSQLHYTLSSFSIDIKPSIILPINDNYNPKKIKDTSLTKDNDNSCQEEENFNNEDLELVDNHDFELLDKGEQVVQETQSNQIEQASDDNYIELIKWHLRIISIKDTFVPEVQGPEGMDFWVILSGIIRGTRNKWHSDAVITREQNRLIKTAKNKSYLLVGKISSKKMKADGFSEELIKAFEDGFPENWQELLFATFRSSSFSFKEESHEISPPIEKRITRRQESKDSPIKRRLKAPAVQKQGETVTSSGRRVRAPGNWWEVNPKQNVNLNLKPTKSVVKSKPNVKEEIAHSKKRSLSSTKKGTSGQSRKRRPSQKDNATGNLGEVPEEATVYVPRHEVYVLVETSKSE